MNCFPLVRILAAALFLVLSGCATLERHPIATAVIAGVVAGSLAAHDGRRDGFGGEMPAICRTNPEACK